MGLGAAGRRICAAVLRRFPTGGSRQDEPPLTFPGAHTVSEESGPIRYPPEAAVFPSRQAYPARTLMDVMCETAAKCPEAPAIDDGTVQLTYRALASRVNALARRLWALDIGAGDRVGVRMQSGSSDLYIAILGVMACGAAYVPVDIEEPVERVETVWAEAGVCAVIAGHLAITQYAAGRTQGRRREPRPADDAWVVRQARQD